MDAYMSVRTNMREPYRIEDSPEVFDLANYVCLDPCEIEQIELTKQSSAKRNESWKFVPCGFLFFILTSYWGLEGKELSQYLMMRM